MAQSSIPGDTADDVAVGAQQAPFSPVYQWYALGLLFVVYVFNFIDRQVLGILAQPIKEDLGLSDTQMGFLGGIAFAIFYTFMGVPIARLADRGSRRNILAICLTIWSAMTALCGFVQSFVQILAARVGVAVGEAGGSPPSHSMISDMFPPHRRATALSIYALGIPVGTMIGNLAGGVINDALNWRTAFILIGAPGILLALMVRLTLREPPRGFSEGLKQTADDAPPIADTFKALWQRRSFRYMSLGGALHAFVGYGVGYWMPAMFMRSHEVSSSYIGQGLFWLGFAGMAGTFAGGWLGDRMARRDVRWYMWLPGLATLVSIPFAAFTYLYDDPTIALWVYTIPIFFGSYYLGPTFSMAQGLVGLRMRALASSLLLFVLNIIGLGLGPQIAGLLSDGLRAYTSLRVDSLRWALVILLIVNVVATIFYLMAGRTLKADLARSHELS